MAIHQWTEEEWKQFEARLEEADTEEEFNTLVAMTREQEEHPEWYDSPCLCQLCLSYGD